jgi:ABC-type sugar transport system permease subunit
MWALVFMSMWVGLGPRMVLFLAGLINIPQSLYEAAQLDGASPWKQFWKVTLPMLVPTTFFVMVTSTIGAMQVFTPVYMMTKGGPEESTDVVGYHIYTEAWVNFNTGLASAKSFVLLAVIVVPQARLLRAAFVGDDGRLTLGHFARFLGGVRYREALANTALAGVLSTALALAIGVPIGFLYARYRLPARTAVLTLATLSTVSPPFLGAYVWMMLLGWSGPVSRALRAAGVPFESILGFHGIVWVTVWSSVGLVVLFAHDAFAGADPSLEEAAQSVGASRWRATLGITLPLAAPGILTAAYLILMAVLTDFGTPKIVGGDVPMLPVLVYHDYLAEVSGNPSMAATASLAMLALSTLLLMLQRLFLARRSYQIASVRRAAPRRHSARPSTVAPNDSPT